MNNKIKFLLSSIITIMFLCFITNNITFAAENISSSIISKHDTSLSINNNLFSISGFASIFAYYYKWIVLWLTIFNLIISGLLALQLLTASDNNSRDRIKTSLIYLNSSYLSLVLLGGMIAFVTSTIIPKTKDINKSNNTLVLGTAFNDVSINNPNMLGFNETLNGDKIKEREINSDITKLQSIIRTKLEGNIKQSELQGMIYSINNVYKELYKNDSDTTKKLLIPETYADFNNKNIITEKVKSLLKNNSISKYDFDNFMKAMDILF